MTGVGSGLVVVDIDPGHGGDATVTRLAAVGRELPPTLTVATGGGGRHLFFAHPGGRVPNAASDIAGVGSTPGLDVRGDGGYVVAPPSPHISGGRYEWASGTLAALPDWLRPPKPHRADLDMPPAVTRQDRYAAAALSGELDRVRQALAGDKDGRGRNHTLNKAAYFLGRLTGTGGILAEDLARSALLAVAAEVGLGSSEAEHTIDSGIRAGAQHPRRFSASTLAKTESLRPAGVPLLPPSAPFAHHSIDHGLGR